MPGGQTPLTVSAWGKASLQGWELVGTHLQPPATGLEAPDAMAMWWQCDPSRLGSISRCPKFPDLLQSPAAPQAQHC